MVVEYIATLPSPVFITAVALIAYFALLCFALTLMFTFYTCRTGNTSASCWILQRTKNLPPDEKYVAMNSHYLRVLLIKEEKSI